MAEEIKPKFPSGQEVIYTNENGDFTIENLSNTIDITTPTPEEIEKISIIISKTGFQSQTIPLYTQLGSKRNLGTINLVDNETYLKKEIRKNQSLSEEQVNNLIKDKKTFEWYAIKNLNTIIDQLKQKALPLLLEPIIVTFGISDPIGLIKQIKEIKEKGQSFIEENQNLSDEEKERRRQQLRETAQTGATVAGTAALNMGKDRIQQEITNLILNNISNPDFCPKEDTLQKIIKRKNSINTQLNRTMKTINFSTNSLDLNATLIEGFEALFQFLKFSPVPIPPFAPISLVGLIEDAKDFADKDIIKKIGSITNSTLAVLVVVRETLIQILDYSNLLDTLIEQCYPLDPSEQVSLNNDLRILGESTPLVGNKPKEVKINGFKLTIENEITENPLKRKRAIAIDPKGVTALKGEYSFSSSDKILIEELEFYIQSNNLKAE